MNPFYRTLQVAFSNPPVCLCMMEVYWTHYSYTFNLQWADLFANANLEKDYCGVAPLKVNGTIIVSDPLEKADT